MRKCYKTECSQVNVNEVLNNNLKSSRDFKVQSDAVDEEVRVHTYIVFEYIFSA